MNQGVRNVSFLENFAYVLNEWLQCVYIHIPLNLRRSLRYILEQKRKNKKVSSIKKRKKLGEKNKLFQMFVSNSSYIIYVHILLKIYLFNLFFF